MDSLLRGLEALSAAATIDDVLTTLIEQLTGEFARVALFRVKGNRLEGAHQIGFKLTNDIRKVMMPLAMDSVLTRAVTSGHTERVSGDDLLKASGLPFGGSPHGRSPRRSSWTENPSPSSMPMIRASRGRNATPPPTT